uniref:CP-type G domain-containing protein n=1 Tax=Setaria digitata TaxID=48799 RepID=A0A915Q7F0_9BILA
MTGLMKFGSHKTTAVSLGDAELCLETWKAKNKPINVPNKCPFKEEILVQAEKERERIELEKCEKKRAVKQKQPDVARVGMKRKCISDDLQSLALKSIKQTEEMSQRLEKENLENLEEMKEKSFKQHANEVWKTVKSADIIIEVLDVRDPLGSRNRNVEESVLNAGKRLVLLLNKIDLVPKENVRKWLSYLRQQLPTIAFKASTQEQSHNLGRFISSNLHSSSSKCIGADLVMKLLLNYCRNKGIKTSICVGVVGYPNVGKSSFINSMKRKRVCNVGALPGITRQMQEVDLGKNVQLLDSPGVILEPKGRLDKSEIALKNAIRVEDLADPVSPVQAILRRCSHDNLIIHYGIPEFKTCEEFLAFIARKVGRLKKGGRPDLNAAARKAEPPENMEYFNSELCSAELLNEMSKEFDLDALNDEQKVLLEDLPTSNLTKTAIKYDAAGKAETEGNDDGAQMEVENISEKTVIYNEEKVGFVQKKSRDDIIMNGSNFPDSFEVDGNSQINRAIRLAVKKHRRKNKKLQKRTDEVINTMTSASLTDKQEDYDFAVMNSDSHKMNYAKSIVLEVNRNNCASNYYIGMVKKVQGDISKQPVRQSHRNRILNTRLGTPPKILRSMLRDRASSVISGLSPAVAETENIKNSSGKDTQIANKKVKSSNIISKLSGAKCCRQYNSSKRYASPIKGMLETKRSLRNISDEKPEKSEVAESPKNERVQVLSRNLLTTSSKIRHSSRHRIPNPRFGYLLPGFTEDARKKGRNRDGIKKSCIRNKKVAAQNLKIASNKSDMANMPVGERHSERQRIPSRRLSFPDFYPIMQGQKKTTKARSKMEISHAKVREDKNCEMKSVSTQKTRISMNATPRNLSLSSFTNNRQIHSSLEVPSVLYPYRPAKSQALCVQPSSSVAKDYVSKKDVEGLMDEISGALARVTDEDYSELREKISHHLNSLYRENCRFRQTLHQLKSELNSLSSNSTVNRCNVLIKQNSELREQKVLADIKCEAQMEEARKLLDRIRILEVRNRDLEDFRNRLLEQKRHQCLNVGIKYSHIDLVNDFSRNSTKDSMDTELDALILNRTDNKVVETDKSNRDNKSNKIEWGNDSWMLHC